MSTKLTPLCSLSSPPPCELKVIFLPLVLAEVAHVAVNKINEPTLVVMSRTKLNFVYLMARYYTSYDGEHNGGIWVGIVEIYATQDELFLGTRSFGGVYVAEKSDNEEKKLCNAASVYGWFRKEGD